MSHEERLSLAQQKDRAATGMVVAGFVVFGGLCGGLWNTMGAGALGAAFGSSCGLWFGSRGIVEEARLIRQWDEELMSGKLAGEIA